MDAITLLKKKYHKTSDEELKEVLARVVLFYVRYGESSRTFYKHSDAFIEDIKENPRGVGIDYREKADIEIPDPRNWKKGEPLLVFSRKISSNGTMDFGEVVDQMTEKQKLDTKYIWITEEVIRINDYEGHPAVVRSVWLFGG
ncbi:MAG: hypothetical protein LBO09_01430 [Candidatus Peribacteria bacterium]|jgi:hypothetical protein|nr:hypothetical protein [Candidatus Peribacteria bacterium]